MRFRVLLGARALVDGKLLVNPALSYLQNQPSLPRFDTPVDAP
jgi:hypothetical protein